MPTALNLDITQNKGFYKIHPRNPSLKYAQSSSTTQITTVISSLIYGLMCCKNVKLLNLNFGEIKMKMIRAVKLKI